MIKKAKRQRNNPLNDADYKKKLSPEDLQWHNRFSDEYYNGASRANKENILPISHKRDCDSARVRQRLDMLNVLITTTEQSGDGSSVLFPGQERPKSKKRRSYGPEDYAPSYQSAEDLIIEVLDGQKLQEKV